jgi:hypothetical protein
LFTVLAVNNAVLEVVFAYRNPALPTGHIIICLQTQIACMLPASSRLITMIVTGKILEVALGVKIGATEFMARNEVHEIGAHTDGGILE